MPGSDYAGGLGGSYGGSGFSGGGGGSYYRNHFARKQALQQRAKALQSVEAKAFGGDIDVLVAGHNAGAAAQAAAKLAVL
jgi:hypothetical protein